MRRRLPRFRFRLIVAEEYQPVHAVPRLVRALTWTTIAVALALQVRINTSIPPPEAAAIELSDPPARPVMNALAAGDQVAFAKMAMLWLQAFDNQQGQSLSFFDLDYARVAAWLEAILALDGRAQYPLFSAARIYAVVRDPGRIITMTEFISRNFADDPRNRWEWMAAAVTLAKNRGNDLERAIGYARRLRELTEGMPEVPGWARQMEIFLQQDNNEFDEAATLMLNLLDSGEVSDPQEFVFLYGRLEEIFRQMIESGQVTSTEEYERMEERYEQIRLRYLELRGAE